VPVSQSSDILGGRPEIDFNEQAELDANLDKIGKNIK